MCVCLKYISKLPFLFGIFLEEPVPFLFCFLLLLTYTLGLLACSAIWAYSSYLTEKTNTIQQIKFVHLFICFSFAGTDPTDSGAELAKLHCLSGETSSLLSQSAGALPSFQARLCESWDTAGQRSGISSTFCLACQVTKEILGKNKTRKRDLKEVPYCL